MISDAGELLERCLAALGSRDEPRPRDGTAQASSLPDAAALLEAFDAFLIRQQDVYDQILLPVFGLGERFDLQANYLQWGQSPDDISHQNAQIKGSIANYRGGEVWLFDGAPGQSWLHAPLLMPFEELEDTLILVNRQQVPKEIIQRLRPPVVAGVRRALGALEWLAVDTGGFEGGRMEHGQFLEEIGDYPWFRLDHDPDAGALRFEAWRGETPLSGWSANAFDAFEWDALARRNSPDRRPISHYESGAPARLAEAWPGNDGASVDGKTPHRTTTFEVAAALDRLHDPYDVCRRLIIQDAGIDIERLGPLVTWKDDPDILVEFTDEDDSFLSDLAGWLSEYFHGAHEDFKTLVDAWFAAIRANLPVHLEGVGELYEVYIPAIRLMRPRPLVGCSAPSEVVLPGRRIFAASSRAADDWVEREDPD